MKLAVRLAVPLALAVQAGLAAESAPAAAASTGAAAPYASNARGIDRRNLDESVSPCVDFYRYANGGWLEKNPIPADQSSWGTMSEMRERNYVVLKEILEASAAANAPKGSNKQKVGDFWATAMDTARIEKEGAAPLAGDLAKIAALQKPADVAAHVNELHRTGSDAVFDLDVDQDLKDSTRYILYASQGGLGLPDRDYYLRDDDEAKTLRQGYRDHVARMLQLIGDSPEKAKAAADAVLALETRLAKASLTRVELRDPNNSYNMKTVAEADALTPHYSWSALLRHLGVSVDSFSFAQPKFLAEVDAALGDTPIDTWKSYLRWHLVHESAPYLSEAFVNEDFAFFRGTLSGAKEQRPRWKRVVDQANASLGQALGEVYVEKAFPPATKQRADEMIKNLLATVGTRLSALDWMGEETRKQALVKLGTFKTKIGYPDVWRDYSALTIGRDSYYANVEAAAAFEVRRQLDRLGKPIDHTDWGMPPQIVNASYNPLRNEITFPAGIMQPPYFDGEADDALNYGGMGGVIGHEVMHGFDDEGSQFDAQGNMKSWWTEADRKAFDERAGKLVAQYDSFVAIGDLHVNGKLTLGENIGDFSGLTMSYYALQTALQKSGKRDKIDGFTPEQRFFLSWAQGWRRNYRDEMLKLQVNTDPHSPAKFRVNGPFMHMPEFAQAFGCKEGDPMVAPAAQRSVIW